MYVCEIHLLLGRAKKARRRREDILQESAINRTYTAPGKMDLLFHFVLGRYYAARH